MAEIEVWRIPYEEPHHAHVNVRASNGAFGGAMDFYCSVDTLLDIGARLAEFPARVPDEYIFEHGSADRGARSTRHFVMRAFTVDRGGQCALHFAMDLNEEPPEEGRAAFSIRMSPQQIARVGSLIRWLHGHPSGWFRWTPDGEQVNAAAHR